MPDEAFDVVVPPELEAGVHAEALTGWFSSTSFVLDFVLPIDEERLLVTSRVRVPAAVALTVRETLNGLIQEYELRACA
jgi:hypothetical protein